MRRNVQQKNAYDSLTFFYLQNVTHLTHVQCTDRREIVRLEKKAGGELSGVAKRQEGNCPDTS